MIACARRPDEHCRWQTFVSLARLTPIVRATSWRTPGNRRRMAPLSRRRPGISSSNFVAWLAAFRVSLTGDMVR